MSVKWIRLLLLIFFSFWFCLFTGDVFFFFSPPVFVRYCKCSKPISISLISSSCVPCPLPTLCYSLGLCFVLYIFLMLGFCAQVNCFVFSPKDSTSGPHNPFWGPLVTMDTKEMDSMENVLCTWRTTSEPFSTPVCKLVPSLAGSSMLFARLWMLH